MKIAPVQLDAETCVYGLSIAEAHIVVLQSLLELYEGIGTLRTLDREQNTMAIFTTPSSAGYVEQLLDDISGWIPWEARALDPALYAEDFTIGKKSDD